MKLNNKEEKLDETYSGHKPIRLNLCHFQWVYDIASEKIYPIHKVAFSQAIIQRLKYYFSWKTPKKLKTRKFASKKFINHLDSK